jgi:hypothetical protein
MSVLSLMRPRVKSCRPRFKIYNAPSTYHLNAELSMKKAVDEAMKRLGPGRKQQLTVL